MPSRIYMRVIVANESNASLRLSHASTSGDWTDSWHPTPGAQPGGTVAWQAEGNILPVLGTAIDGVEARVSYEIIGETGAVLGELYIFADSPWVESQYGNTFHVHTASGFYAAYVDAQGQKNSDNRAQLNISFRNTRRVAVPGFRPSVNGFQFPNKWSSNLPAVTMGSIWNRFRKSLAGGLADALGIPPISEQWLPITQAGGGLCGGMAFAAMDYFYAHQLPPVPALDAHGKAIAPDSPNDPLFEYIRERLMDSFDFAGRGSRWLAYTSPIYPDDDEGVFQTLGQMKGKSWVTYREEWPRIRESLDNGRLATVGLVQAANFDIGENHQVLAYAYEQSGQVVKLWVYDSKNPIQENAAADDLYLEFDITDTSNGITVSRHNFSQQDYKNRIYAMLYMDSYAQHWPPNGRPIPPVLGPKVLNIYEADAESHTTDGHVTREETNFCGDVLHFGRWTSWTAVTLAAQVSGFFEPVVTWTVAGQTVTAETHEFFVAFEGRNYRIGCVLNPGGRSIQLTSAPGDAYKISVVVMVKDALSNTATAETAFAVDGEYEGMKIEDIRAETLCIARNIPRSVDVGVFTVPHGPEEPGWAIERWKEGALERLHADQNVNPASRAAISSFIELQAATPAFRPVAQNIANRRRR